MGICSVWELPSYSELKNVLLMVELMTYYTISCRMTGQKPKTALGTDSTHTTWDWRGYITSLWSGSQSPMPLLWYQPECWITACRLRAATPAWLKSGRFLHLDEQSLSFFSCLSKFWLVLPVARLPPRLCQYFWEQLHLLLKEGQMSLMKNWLSLRQCTGQLHRRNTAAPGQRY